MKRIININNKIDNRHILMGEVLLKTKSGYLFGEITESEDYPMNKLHRLFTIRLSDGSISIYDENGVQRCGHSVGDGRIVGLITE